MILSHEDWNNSRFRQVARWLREDAKPLIKNTLIVSNSGKSEKEAYNYFKAGIDSGTGINNSSLRNTIDYAISDYGINFVASGLFNALFKKRPTNVKKAKK